MQILGIDYGTKKIGLALAVGKLAEPYSVIKYKDEEDLFDRLGKIILKENIEKIVIGLSEGETAQKTIDFVNRFKEHCKLPFEFVDETLSTQEAQKMAMEAGMKRNKRKALEDAFAASIMLQLYLDNYV